MFIDRVELSFFAGKGGNGIVSWRREKYIPKGGPVGGDGGKGGSIFFETDNQVMSLQSFRNITLIEADNGRDGGSSQRTGRGGKDLIIKIPCGTHVKDAVTGEVLFDCVEHGQRFLICQGGKGGRGNEWFKSPTNQAPSICTEGLPGEQKKLLIELKLIADVGLIGIPNAGKSSLMASTTNAEVKIGAYPFTTLHPNLSFIQFEDRSRILIADIPGIIENAHEDRGLGLAFLKHIERTSTLVFVIDCSGEEGRDPIDDYLLLRNELKEYDKKILKKSFLIALNKVDLPNALENAKRFRKKFPKDAIFEISALNKIGLKELVQAMRALVQQNNA